MPVVILAMIIVPVYTLILLFFGRRCVSVSAEFNGADCDSSVTRGDELTVVITVKNSFFLPRAPLRVYGVFYDDGELKRRCLLANVGARRSVTLRISHIMNRRGGFCIGPVYVEMYDMLKIFCLRKDVESQRKTVTVLPREKCTEAVERVLREADRYSETHAGLTRRSEIIPQSRRLSGEYTDFREYREGDSPKMIHWKMSAKSDVLLTRISERGIETGDATVVCDFRYAGSSAREAVRITDEAIESTLYFIKSLIKEDRECTVYLASGGGEGIPVRHMSDYEELRRVFSRVPVQIKCESGENTDRVTENITRRLISEGVSDRFTLVVACSPIGYAAFAGLHNCEILSVTE
ncbi:hypothetical protein FACS1894120_3450 [Clostridia bacterium]|nr:hypothetical protein FACS1894120_3450 [Clostridia bacterium]